MRHITNGLRSGAEESDDFQDIRMWRSLTVFTAQQFYQTYQRPLIVPMTLASPAYFTEIHSGLSAIAPLHHFCLTASLRTVQQRLQERGDGPDPCQRKAAICIPLLNDPMFAVHIDTERRTTIQIVDVILAHLRKS